MSRIAILSALAEEQSGLRQQLVAPERIERGGREFWCGDLYGQPVVLALSRIGKVAAATTATTLIEHLDAQSIVFTGVAGGLARDVKVGDVVVASAYLQHDMDASPLFPRHEVPLYGQSRFATDAFFSEQLMQAALTLPLAQARVHRGLIVSGDRFVATSAESRALQTQLPDALAVEMEGAAVAQVCHDYEVPFAAMRSVSDRADDDAHEDFARFVQEVASRYADHVIGAWLKMLPK